MVIKCHAVLLLLCSFDFFLSRVNIFIIIFLTLLCFGVQAKRRDLYVRSVALPPTRKIEINNGVTFHYSAYKPIT